MGNIVDTNGKPITTEIASIKRDPLHPLFSGLIQPKDDTLLTRGQGKGIKIYEEIERDPYAFACLHKRKMAVISRPWEVRAASEKPQDKQAAEIVEQQLKALNFDQLCMNLLDAINKGFAVGEILWDTDGIQVIARDVRARDQLRFTFGEDYELRLKTQTDMLKGEPMPDKKFIVHSLGAKDANPYGLGLGSKLFWPVWFKRQGITFWMTFLDKFGSPTAVGEYPAGTSIQDQQDLLSALASISQDAGVVFSQGMSVKLLEAARGGNAGYETLCKYMDEQIAYCILGEAPNAKGSGGAAASAAITRNEIRLELVQFDSDVLSATLNNTLIKWISEFNVPGATPPTVWREVADEQDILVQAQRDQLLFEMGMRPDEDYQAVNYPGWKFTAAPSLPPKLGTTASFAETAGPTAAANLTDKMNSDSDAAWNAVMQHVTDLVDKADDLQSLQSALTDAYSGLPLDDLRKIMAQAFQIAVLAGMADVADGN